MAEITGISIHPAIGIARVGNSEDCFVGPERPGVNPVPEGGYKDEAGKIKKQAARFRVFAKYDDGAVEEYHGPVSWKVELANKKAVARAFASRLQRNANVVGAEERGKLVMEGKAELSSVGDDESISDTVEVVDAGGSPIGPPRRVELGKARIKVDGQLLVLGGSGTAFPVTEPPAPLNRAFNNDEWRDDTSDGRITAKITIDGTPHVSTAWVIVAPPKFAPQLTPIVSLWDRLVDAHVTQSVDEPSYRQHIQPILDRARKMRWVHEKADKHDTYWASDPIEEEWIREHLYKKLKGSGEPGADMPVQETEGRGPDADPEGDRLTGTQLRWMGQWSKGNFTRDWHIVPKSNPSLTPDDLDRAALEACTGAALYPGIEAGQYLLQKKIWNPFPRLNTAVAEPDDAAVAEADGAAAAEPDDLIVVEPGDVTAGMALPWHTDFRACNQDWWPVARPNQVRPQRAPDTYEKWDRQIQTYGRMVDAWHTLGFVIPQGEEFLEVEAADAPYVFVVSPEVAFAAVPEGETETHAVSLEAATGPVAVTLNADPPTGPFSLVSPEEVELQPNTGPQTVEFLVQYNGGTTAEEGELTVHGPRGRDWTVRLRVTPPANV